MTVGHGGSHLGQASGRARARRTPLLAVLRRPLLTVLLVVGGGLLFTAAAVSDARHAEETEESERFAHSAHERAEAIRRALEIAQADLLAATAFFDSSKDVDRDEFGRFAGKMQPHHRGEVAIAWVPRVAAADRARYEDVARHDGLRSFGFTELGPGGALVPERRRDEYSPVYFVTPFDRALLGFDLGTDPPAASLLDRAGRVGPAVSSAPLPLDKGGRGHRLVLVAAPVRRRRKRDGSEPLEGFVVAALRLDLLVEDAVRSLAPSGLDVYLLDDDGAAGRRILDVHRGRLSKRDAPPLDEAALAGARRIDTVFAVADDQWRVACVRAEGVPPPAGSGHWRVLGSFGLAGTLLLGLLTWTSAARAAETERHSAEQQLSRQALDAETLERKRVEAARESAAVQLDAMRRYSNDIFLLVTLDGAIAQANDRALRSYGYSADEITSLHITDLRAPETRASTQAELRLAVRDGGLRFETIHRRRDGTTFPVEVSTRPIDLSGRTMLQSVIRDLTQERAARAVVDHQAMLLENLHEAVVALDAGQVITAWNRSAERLFGWPRAEVIGHPAPEILLDAGGSIAWFAGGVRDEPTTATTRLRSREGASIDLESTTVPLRDQNGRSSGHVIVFRDVTAARRAEADTRKAQARLRAILASANEGVWVLDPDGVTELVNRRLLEMFQLPAGGLLGKRLVDLIPAAGGAVVAAHGEALAHGERVRNAYTLRPGTPSEVQVLLSRSPIEPEDGGTAGEVAVFTDITALRRAELQLQQSAKMEAIGTLASGIAHDFNNILVVIQSYSQFMLDALDPSDRLWEDAHEIHEAGERAARLVRQLLAIGRRSEARPVNLDVSDVVMGMEKFLGRTLGANIVIGLSLAPAACRARIDRTQLELVLINLCVNARDAMPNGGALRIEVRHELVEQAPLDLPALGPGHYAVLAVTDSGCGMSPEVVTRVFEPFFTTKELGKGTGLGLSTVYGIVRQAGGLISVASVPGRGTTVTVHLPACDAAEPTSPSPVPAAPASPQARRILVVEDEDGVRRAVKRVLEDAGHAVVEACDATEGFTRLGEQAFDLVLSDVMMPLVSGLDLAAVARELRPGLRVLFMSGYADRALGLESEQVLAKPFTSAELLAAVGGALEQGAGDASLQAAEPGAFGGSEDLDLPARLAGNDSRGVVAAQGRAEMPDQIEASRRDLARMMKLFAAGEARIRAVLEAAIDGVLSLASDGRVQGMNAAAEHIFGRTRAEVVGEDFCSSLIAESSRAEFSALITSGTGVTGRRGEAHALRGDGVVFPLEYSLTPLDTSAGAGFCVFVRDVTVASRAPPSVQLPGTQPTATSC